MIQLVSTASLSEVLALNYLKDVASHAISVGAGSAALYVGAKYGPTVVQKLLPENRDKK